MKKTITVPSVGESINEATVAEWKKSAGDYVESNEVLVILETDKASVEIVAEYPGTLSISAKADEVVAIGAILGEIDTATNRPAGQTSTAPAATPTTVSAPVHSGNDRHGPAVRKIAAEKNINTQDLKGSGKSGRLTKADALNLGSNSANAQHTDVKEETIRKPMSRFRKTIAKRLVQAQQTAATLTTFNEIDMSATIDLRSKYKEDFKQQHDVSLGFMGFFVKAVVAALKEFPQVASQIDGDDLVYKNFVNMGIAVSTEKGLVVPVIRKVDQMSLPNIEKSVAHYATKARQGSLSLDDLSGGTFTISNGGVFGSLMSTPILNPPQSGILGLHKIEKRPVAINDQVVIRPMMYVALSYDHRVIDGKESVKFLANIKENLEYPGKLLLDL